VVDLPLVALEGVHWARDGPKFACKVNGCDASYIPNYNFVRHLRHATMWLWKPSKFRRPFTREEGPRHQDHMAMNVQV